MSPVYRMIFERCLYSNPENLRDVWIRIQRAAVASRRATDFLKPPTLCTTKYKAQDCNTAARPPNDCFAGGWVILSYDKSDVTELAEPPDVLHGREAGARVVAVVEHRRLRAVRQLHMLGLTQRAATYILLTANCKF